MTMPYAPVEKTASRSPRPSGGRGRSFARKSPLSQTGPTTSQGSAPGAAASKSSGGAGNPAGTFTGHIRGGGWWSAGRIEVFHPGLRAPDPLLAGLLGVAPLAERPPPIPGDPPAGLPRGPAPGRLPRRHDRPGELADRPRLLASVGDPEASA